MVASYIHTMHTMRCITYNNNRSLGDRLTLHVATCHTAHGSLKHDHGQQCGSLAQIHVRPMPMRGRTSVVILDIRMIMYCLTIYHLPFANLPTSRIICDGMYAHAYIVLPMYCTIHYLYVNCSETAHLRRTEPENSQFPNIQLLRNVDLDLTPKLMRLTEISPLGSL